MTIVMTAPNGASVQFPDGTDSATINDVMNKNFQASAPSPDKYQQAAIDEQASLKAAGGSEGAGLTRRLAHGATLGADSTILAAAQTPLEMIRQGTFNPVEGYKFAKAREDQIMGDARKNTGVLGTGAELLGGVVGGGAVTSGLGTLARGAGGELAAAAGNGLTASRLLAPEAGILKRAAASAADGVGVGAFSGGMEGNGLAERGTNALQGGAVGGVIGGALPLGFAGLNKGLFSPIAANWEARMNPTAYAEKQVARGVHESGKSPDDISLDTIGAHNEGQGVYTVADSMGNAGQRLLSTVTRSPGEGRTMAVHALDARQGDQGRRLATSLREGFDAPQTADATRTGMVDAANFEAGHNYAPVKRETSPIDVSAPVAIANRAISPAADRLAAAQGAVPTDLAARAGIERGEAVLRDPIGSALKEARSYLAAPTLTSSNVNQAFRAKTNIDMMIAGATEKGQGALVAELMPIQKSLDEALANTSSNYAHARDSYRIAQQRINALDLGKLLGSKPVRPEDAIRQFGALPDAEAQQAFRAGYVDPQISQVQNAAFGTNKARPLTSDAVKQEFDAFAAPGRADQLQRQIGREQTMFETRNQAMGGSKTADNLHDDAAMGATPELVGFVGHILSGNVSGAMRTALHAGANLATGNTPAVRAEVAKILLQRGGNMNPATLTSMVDQVIGRMQHIQSVVAGLGQAGRAGVTAATAEGLSRH